MEAVALGRPEAFEGWLLRRMNKAVDTGEMAADVLAEIEADLAAPALATPAVRHPIAIRLIAELARVPREQAGKLLTALETKCSSDPVRALQEITEAWLRQRRQVCPSRNR